MILAHYEPPATDMPHWRVYSLPREIVVVLHPGQKWPAGIDSTKAILAWQGHASDLNEALKAAF